MVGLIRNCQVLNLCLGLLFLSLYFHSFTDTSESVWKCVHELRLKLITDFSVIIMSFSIAV